jgi:ATP-dependent Lon protease
MKVVKHQQLKQEGGVSLSVTQNMLEDLIGLPPFEDTYVRKNTPGLGVGLAYNAYGGSLMYIEIVRTNYVGDAEVIKDKSAVGSLKITGQLGNTIKESVQIAYTHAKYVLHQHYGNHFLEDS